MTENRLLRRVVSRPFAIREVNAKLATEPETAAHAMAHAMPKEYVDRGLAIIEAIANGTHNPRYSSSVSVETYKLLTDPKRCWTLRAIAGLQGVNETTFFEWIERHDELQFALAQGRAIQENNFGSMLLHGFKYSSGVEFILTNLHNWTLKQRTEHSVDLNAAIQAQEKARKAIVWDETSAQLPAAPILRGATVEQVLVGKSPEREPVPVRDDDSDYKG